MKALIIVLALSFTSLCHAQFISDDGELHFAAGALISATTYTIVYTTTKNKKKAFWMSLGAATLVGVAKETLDSGKENNKFDSGDLAATSLGGLTASFTLDLFVGKNKNKKNVALVN